MDDIAESAASRPSARGVETRDPARIEADRQIAADFRRATQPERLADPRLNVGAKIVAAADAAIEARFGVTTPEALRLKDAAREAVAQNLGRGVELSAPRLQAADRQFDAELARQDARVDRDPAQQSR